MLDSLAIRFEDNAIYSMNWQEDGFFIVALLINLLSVLIVIVLYILHRCWWENVYNKQREVKISSKLIKDHWENKECDE